MTQCAGCESPIHDKYLYNVLDRPWHGRCLQCVDCSLPLSEKCFFKEGKLFCRTDFYKRYGTKCAGCGNGICPTDLVRRAKTKVFHIKCFKCMVCHKQLCTGEELYIVEEQFICKEDYLNMHPDVYKNMIFNDPSVLPKLQPNQDSLYSSVLKKCKTTKQKRPKGASIDCKSEYQASSTGQSPTCGAEQLKNPPTKKKKQRNDKAGIEIELRDNIENSTKTFVHNNSDAVSLSCTNSSYLSQSFCSNNNPNELPPFADRYDSNDKEDKRNRQGYSQHINSTTTKDSLYGADSKEHYNLATLDHGLTRPEKGLENKYYENDYENEADSAADDCEGLDSDVDDGGLEGEEDIDEEEELYEDMSGTGDGLDDDYDDLISNNGCNSVAGGNPNHPNFGSAPPYFTSNAAFNDSVVRQQSSSSAEYPTGSADYGARQQQHHIGRTSGAKNIHSNMVGSTKFASSHRMSPNSLIGGAPCNTELNYYNSCLAGGGGLMANNNCNNKRRGPRTTIKAKQLETLKSAFSATPKPTRHIREQLARETGLNMRVIQVWFQNRRSKERRMKQLSALGARRHFFRHTRRIRSMVRSDITGGLGGVNESSVLTDPNKAGPFGCGPVGPDGKPSTAITITPTIASTTPAAGGAEGVSPTMGLVSTPNPPPLLWDSHGFQFMGTSNLLPLSTKDDENKFHHTPSIQSNEPGGISGEPTSFVNLDALNEASNSNNREYGLHSLGMGGGPPTNSFFPFTDQHPSHSASIYEPINHQLGSDAVLYHSQPALLAPQPTISIMFGGNSSTHQNLGCNEDIDDNTHMNNMINTASTTGFHYTPLGDKNKPIFNPYYCNLSASTTESSMLRQHSQQDLEEKYENPNFYHTMPPSSLMLQQSTNTVYTTYNNNG